MDDDSQPIVDLIADVLTDEGYTICAALTLNDALQLVAERRPNLVLLDLLILGSSGNALAHEINAAGLEPIPIIMMTADAKAAQELSMEDIAYCLVKPFDLDELVDCVANYIRQSCAPIYDKALDNSRTGTPRIKMPQYCNHIDCIPH